MSVQGASAEPVPNNITDAGSVVGAGGGDVASPSSSTSTSTSSSFSEIEDPTTHRCLLEMLHARGVTFSTLSHTPTRTSEESAAARGATLASGAKAMLLKASSKKKEDSFFFLVVLSASKKAELKKLKSIMGVKDLRMASPEEVKAITGCIPGAVPPFGSLWKTPMNPFATSTTTSVTDTGAGTTTITTPVSGITCTIVDNSIVEQGETINFNSGLRTASVVGLLVKDYLGIENPRMESFST